MTAGLNMAALLLVAVALVAAGAIALDSWATRPPRGNRLSNGARESTFVSVGRCPPRPAGTVYSARRLGRGGAAEAPNAARTPAGGCRPWAGRCSPAARPGSTGEVPIGA